MEKTKREKISYQTTFGERMAFGVYGIGLNIFFVIIGSFLQQYYLINVALPAGVVAAIFLVVKIWDGVNDPLFGIILDKARLKSGKYVPWMRIATVFLPFTATCLFFVPLEAPIAVKAAFLLIGYMLYDASATMTEVPYFAITTAMTENPTERSRIISISKIIALLPAFAVLFIPTMYTQFGWKPTILLFSGLAMLSMLPGCFKLKERSLTRPEEPPKLKELLRYIKSNKFLLIFFLSAIIYGLTNTVGTVGNLFAIYNLGGDEMIVPILIISSLPGILAILVVNVLLTRFDKKQLVLGALTITGIASVVMYFAGYKNMPLFYTLSAIRGFSAGAHTMLFFLFTPDFSEYGTYITGTQAEGAAFSIQSFASKVLGAISSATSLFILGAFGFVEGAAAQTEQVKAGIWLLYSAFPVIGAIIQAAILILFYKLSDKDVRIMIQANHGEITYEEADALLGGKHVRKCAE